MTTENTTVETTKKSLNEKTNDRIAYHVAAGEKKAARLLTLKEGTPAHSKCVESIRKNDELLAQLRSQLAARLEKAAAAEASNDTTPAAPVSVDAA